MIRHPGAIKPPPREHDMVHFVSARTSSSGGEAADLVRVFRGARAIFTGRPRKICLLLRENYDADLDPLAPGAQYSGQLLEASCLVKRDKS